LQHGLYFENKIQKVAIWIKFVYLRYMAWYNFKKTKVQGYAEQDNTGAWMQYFRQYSDLLGTDKLEKLNDTNAYTLGTSLAEVFIPIDVIADRVSSVEYVLRYIETQEEYKPSPNLKRLISQPNPIDRLNDLVYKSVVSDYAAGESFIYTKTPDSIKNPTIDNIANIWVLMPNVTKPKLKKEVPNPFLIKDKNELIEYYATFFLINHKIDPRYITHRTITGLDENFCAKSPLLKVSRNINNLLAVYQARYNVYAKNGNGGILSRDAGTNLGAMQDVVDPATREDMLKDLNDRNGITGNKNFIGISSIPMKFIKTLGTISELEPFKETEADMITIGGMMGVNKYLLPISEGTTFTNQQDAEKGLWQNVIKSLCEDKAKDLTKAFYLPEGVAFFPDFSKVEVLQEDKKTGLDADNVLITNLQALTEAGQDVKAAYASLKDKYNG